MPFDTNRPVIEPLVIPFAEFATTTLRMQQTQLEAIAAWQASLAALQREMWDEWTCRWAGGVPIDG